MSGECNVCGQRGCVEQTHCAFAGEISRLREELERWRNAQAHVEADHPDERHCGCVAILRKQLTDAAGEIELLRRERDEAHRLAKHYPMECELRSGSGKRPATGK